MARVIAVAAVLAALLGTTPASAESVCVHKDNCYSIAGPVGGGMTDHFTVKLRLFGAEVVKATGVKFYNGAPIFQGGTGAIKVQPCVNGCFGGLYGYQLITDQFGNRVNIYIDGRCMVFADHHQWVPQTCHTEG